MSDNIPFEMQVEIIKRIPDVKSLIKFRSVSKPWKSFIDSPEFITEYHIDNTQPRHHMLIRYNDPIKFTKTKYISIIDNDNDNDSFGQYKFPLTIPDSVNRIIGPKIFGSSKGLFCFYSNKAKGDKNIIVIWNPSIRKSVTIDMPRVLDTPYKTVIGFGVSPYSSEPKLVKIQTVDDVSDLEDISAIPKRVEVYSLGTKEWRTLSEDDMPSLSVAFTDDRHVVIDENIYWLARDRRIVNGMSMKREMIVLFDMINEEFDEINLPDNVLKDDDLDLSICMICECLGVVGYNDRVEKRVYHVWMMEDDGSEYFFKMCTISRPEEGVSTVLAFRNNGDPIIGIEDEFIGSDDLHVYDPDSEEISRIGIHGSFGSCYASSYMETLLLLDH